MALIKIIYDMLGAQIEEKAEKIATSILDGWKEEIMVGHDEGSFTYVNFISILEYKIREMKQIRTWKSNLVKQQQQIADKYHSAHSQAARAKYEKEYYALSTKEQLYRGELVALIRGIYEELYKDFDIWYTEWMENHPEDYPE